MPLTGNGSWLMSCSTAPMRVSMFSLMVVMATPLWSRGPPVPASIGARWPARQLFQSGMISLYSLGTYWRLWLDRLHMVDDLDVRLLTLLDAEPRIGVLECSRRLGVARGTVQARLDRMLADGVIRSLGPQLEPAALGYGVTAFVTLELRQGRGHAAVAADLAAVPEVLEAYTITGSGDMFCRLVARSNADMQRVIDMVLEVPGIVRTSTVIALSTQVPYRVLPLVNAALEAGDRRRNGDDGLYGSI